MYLSTVCGVVLLHRALISHTFPNNLVGFILEIPVGDKVERKAEFQQKQNISVFSVKCLHSPCMNFTVQTPSSLLEVK